MSTVTARWLSDAEATSTALLGRAPAAARALRAGRCALCSPTRAACCSRSGRARRCRRSARQACVGTRALPPAIPSLADAAEREPEALAAALGQVWSLGAAIDWDGYRAHRAPPPRARCRRIRSSERATGSMHPRRPRNSSPHTSLPVAGRDGRRWHPSSPERRRRPLLLPIVAPGSVASIGALVEDVSGLDVADADPATPWLELGLDSLTLTQLALHVQRTHGVKVTFRQVMESYPTIAGLAHFLDEQLPSDATAGRTGPAGGRDPLGGTGRRHTAGQERRRPARWPAALRRQEGVRRHRPHPHRAPTS